MLDTLITSQTRIKLLLKFFLNAETKSYLRNLEEEFNESSNAVRIELQRFEKAGLLVSFNEGNKKYYKANKNHPLFRDIHNIVIKYVGIDQIIERVIQKLGNIKKVFLTGSFYYGIDNNIIDLIIIAENFDINYFVKLIQKAEKLVKRKIRYIVYTEREFKDYKVEETNEDLLLLWAADKNI